MVHLIYKTQVLMKAEVQEGTDSTPGASDALLAIDPASTPTRTSNERRVASVSLSRERAVRGRQSHAVTFGLDLRGRGTLSKPELSLPFRVCGMRELAVYTITVGSTTGFAVGEIVRQIQTSQDGGLTTFPSQSAVGVVVEVTDATHLKLGLKSQLTFCATGTGAGNLLDDLSGGATTSAISAVASAANQYVYVPDSVRAIYIPLSGLLSGLASPDGDYEGEGVTDSLTTPTWAGTIRRYDHFAATPALYVDLAFGQPPIGGAVITASGWTGTIEPGIGWSSGWVPTATVYVNTDSYRKKCTGARGNYVIRGQVGETGRVDFTFNGKIGTLGDAAFAANATFDSDAQPLVIMGTAYTFNGVQIPTGSIELDFGANVVMRGDLGDATGDISAMITERDPVWRLDPEWQPAVGVDIHGLWSNQTLFPIHMQFGTSSGNIVIVHAPQCEITNVGNGNRDGIWTGELEVRPRRVTGNGDDEFFIYIK